jgi:hypothetical protein
MVGLIKVVALALGVVVVAASVVGLVVAGPDLFSGRPKQKGVVISPSPDLASQAWIPTAKAVVPAHTETATFALG